MEAENKASYSYRLASGREFNITMRTRLHIPGDPNAHVSIALLCAETWSDYLMDTLSPQLYRGVHGGLGQVPLPFPPGNLRIEVVEFDASPSLNELAENLGVQLPVDVIEVLVSHNVASLWYGLVL